MESFFGLVSRLFPMMDGLTVLQVFRVRAKCRMSWCLIFVWILNVFGLKFAFVDYLTGYGEKSDQKG